MFTATAFCTILGSLIAFTCLNISLQYYKWIPLPFGYNNVDQQHKWRNAIGSLVHACIIGILSFLSLPALWNDFIKNYTQLGEVTIGIAVGYAIYDSVDLSANKPLRVIWPLLIHHFIIVYYSSTMLWWQFQIAYAILGFTVEVNSVALHIRQLLLMYGITKQSTIFKINNVFNFITFIFLRIPSFILILIFLIGDRDRMLSYWNVAMLLGTIGLLFVNMILFKRLIFSDLLMKKSNKKYEVNGNIMDR